MRSYLAPPPAENGPSDQKKAPEGSCCQLETRSGPGPDVANRMAFRDGYRGSSNVVQLWRAHERPGHSMNLWPFGQARHKGQAMVEYTVILVLVAVVVLTVVMALGNQVTLTFQDIQEAIANPNDPGSSSPYTCPDGTTAILHGHKYHCQ